jgi:hypothetical protein
VPKKTLFQSEKRLSASSLAACLLPAMIAETSRLKNALAGQKLASGIFCDFTTEARPETLPQVTDTHQESATYNYKTASGFVVYLFNQQSRAAAEEKAKVGDTRLKSAKIGVSNILTGPPESFNFDEKKAAIVDFAKVLDNPIMSVATSGIPRVSNIYDIAEHALAFATFVPSAASATSGGNAGAVSWYMSQVELIITTAPPLQAWTSIQMEVYTEKSYFFGLFKTQSWVAQTPIITPVYAGSIRGFYGYHDMAAKAAAQQLSQQLKAMNTK